MKNIYTVVCYKIPNANNGIPEKAAGNLYFTIEALKTGCNLKAEVCAISCEYMHLCESKKQAEELKTFWEECEKKNRTERDAMLAWCDAVREELSDERIAEKRRDITRAAAYLDGIRAACDDLGVRYE